MSQLAEPATADSPRRSVPVRPKKKKKNRGQRLTRQLHAWFSMFALLVLLFFGCTGLTLHHQDWTFGIEPAVSTVTGTLPDGSITEAGPDYLVISEYLRANQGASGQITDYGLDGETGRIDYASPGSSSQTTFSTTDRSFEMTSTSYGLVTFANNLHRGENTSSAWGWVIDITAVGLILISITGLILQLLIPKRRTAGLILLGCGVIGAVVLMAFA